MHFLWPYFKRGETMTAHIYKNKKPIIFFLAPAFAFIIIFLYYPFIQNIINSFQEISGLGSSAKGWADPWYSNYVKLIKDENMWIALKNTLIMLLVTVFGQVGIALLLSILTDRISHGAKFFRVVYFFPIVISATALGLLFNLIFLYDKGMINQLREIFGATELVDFKSKAYALITMMIPVMWQYVGFYFIILVTGLNNISTELYEAAAIDGATPFQQVKFISLPLLQNVISTCVILAVTGSLKVFDLPWTMFPKGLPNGETWLTGTYMYYQVFNANNVDYSSAIAVVIVILGVILSKLVNSIFKEKEF